MSANSLPVNPDHRSKIAFAPAPAASPIVRHVAREMPLRWQTADLNVSHRLPSASHSPSIVAQAREIVDCILNDPDPRLAENRQRLRAWVDAYPGSPDRALLEHLIETCSQTNAQRQRDAADPVVVHYAIPR
jgi:hypothetical protein